jgi:transcriptional regulator with XRE-family HTH domain
MTAYGETLARYRDEVGLNQRQLGAAIGLDHTQVNKIERGHRPPLGAKYVQPLVRALHLSRSEAEKLVVDLGGLSPKVLDFMGDVADGQPVKSKQQAIPTPLPTMARPALSPLDSLYDAIFYQIETDTDSRNLSEEEKKRWAAGLLEANKLLLNMIKPQLEKRKED